MNRLAWAATIGAWLAVGAAAPAWANVIADWDEKAIAVTAPLASVPSASTPYAAYRMMGMVHAAMFDAVNLTTGAGRIGAAARRSGHVEGGGGGGGRRRPGHDGCKDGG
jgi:hypothetical protein